MTYNVSLKKLRAPVVSIVMTIYNEAHCVDDAIKTLQRQTYKKIELILVNNGSTDGTSITIAKYKKDRRVRILSLPKNLGPGGGRNAGAKIARGQILVFIDADMVFDKRYIELLTKPIIVGKTVGTLHGKELVANPENIWARSLCINRMPEKVTGSGVYRAVLRKPFLAVGGFDVSKGYFDDDLRILGVSTVTPATCYHKNPDNLREVFHHSVWVGKSMIRSKGALTDHMKNHLPFLFLGAIAFLAALVYSVLHHSLLLLAAICVVCLWLLLFLNFAARRMIKEKEPLYVLSIPILWSVRLAGYTAGVVEGRFVKDKVRRK